MQQDVFVAYYERHYNLIHSVAHQRLGSMSDAEDITAETFRITWEHYCKGGELELRWQYRVLRNLIGDEYRRIKRSRDLPGALEFSETEVVAEEFNSDVLDVGTAMEKLAEPDRELIRMSYWEDLSHKEVGNCSVAAPRR